MEKKEFVSIGLMSGTSMDGVDASIIRSNGTDELVNILDRYYEFDKEIYEKLVNLRNLINLKEDLDKYYKQIETLDRELTLFHGKIVNQIIKEVNIRVNLIGFHGQTIYHNSKAKISKQLGNGELLSQLTNCTVVNNFRKQDLDNYGQGAPLTPIFHYLISNQINKKNKLTYPINIINIGGITNVTTILDNKDIDKQIFAYDIGPGNCLIDEWVRKKSNKKFDENGSLALSGKANQLILNQSIDNFQISSIEESMDINDFDISFVKGLNLEDGCATLNEFTAYLISEGLKKINQINNIVVKNFIICGGGRKNKKLVENIYKYMSDEKLIIKDIDVYQFDGDFIESQAFGYLAARRILELPITFPTTTRCKNPSLGGQIIKNY